MSRDLLCGVISGELLSLGHSLCSVLRLLLDDIPTGRDNLLNVSMGGYFMSDLMVFIF